MGEKTQFAGAGQPNRKPRPLAPRPEFSRIGNHLALDFINTVAWRESEEPQELLASYTDFLRWCRATDLLTQEQSEELRALAKMSAEQAANALDRVLELREISYSVLRSIAHRQKPAPHDLSMLNQHVARLQKRNQIEWASGRLKWKARDSEVALDMMFTDVVWGVTAVLTEAPFARIKQCADDRGCGWLFLDDSKNNSRRWCSAADCGNRAKVLEHYRRKRERQTAKKAGKRRG